MSVAALSIFGLSEADMEDTNNTYLFPDNWDTFMVFEFMSTQWRTTTGGVTGLDYNVIPLAFQMIDVDKEDQTEVMHGVRVMETTAISIMQENQQNNKR